MRRDLTLQTLLPRRGGPLGLFLWLTWASVTWSQPAAVTSPYPLNPDPRGHQDNPRVVANSEGRFFTFWRTLDDDWILQGREIGLSGEPLSAPRILHRTTSFLANPTVVADTTGGLLAIWPEGGQIVARRFDSNLEPHGELVPLVASHADYVEACWSTDGRIHLVWVLASSLATLNVSQIESLGTPATRTFRLEPYSYGAPDIACAANGRFAVSWRANGPIFVQRFDAEANLDGEPIEVGSDSFGDPKLAMLPDGRFATFHNQSEARFYEADGTPNGHVEILEPAQLFWDIKPRDESSYTLVWRRALSALDLSPDFLLHQDFDGQGAPLAVASRLTTASRDVTDLDFAVHSGRLLAVWGDGNDGDGFGLATQLFDGTTPGLLTFASESQIVTEGQPEVVVSVQRIGGSLGPVSARVVARPGTATPGIDYEPFEQIVDFGDQDSQIRTLDLRLLDDPEMEEIETLHLELRDLTGGASIGPIPDLEVELRDNDSPILGLAGSQISIATGGSVDQQVRLPKVSLTPEGSFLATWSEFSRFSSWARRFDRDDQPLEDAVDLSSFADQRVHYLTSSTAHDNGQFSLVWLGFTEIFRESSNGDWYLLQATADEPWPAARSLYTFSGAYCDCGGNGFPPALAPREGGGLDLVLDRELRFDVERFRLDHLGQLGDPVPLGEREPDFLPENISSATQPAGDAVTLWPEIFDGSTRGIAVRGTGPDSSPQEETGILNVERQGLQHQADIASLGNGQFLAVWETPDPHTGTRRIVGRLLARDGTPLGEELTISDDSTVDQTRPRIASDGADQAVVVWQTGGPPEPTGIRAQLFDARGRAVGSALDLGDPQRARARPEVSMNLAGEAVVVWEEQPDEQQTSVKAQRLRVEGSCRADAHTLCLHGGRFKVRARWTNPYGPGGGLAEAAELTADTGTFWFFEPSNRELVVKVLDGRSSNGHFWVYYGALSDLEYLLTVTDTVTGKTRAYFNPGRTQASSGDILALPADGETPTRASTSRSSDPAKKTAGDLVLGRFRAEVTWTDFAGNQGQATAVPLSDNTLAFWFYDDQNIELVLKMLTSGTTTGDFWMFYGALSNVAFDVVLTDTETGATRAYSNPLGQFGSRSDLQAFPQ